MSDPSHNPYAKGLLVPLSGATAQNPPPGTPVVMLAGTPHDISPYLNAYVDLGAMVSQFARSPMDPRALINMQQMSQKLIPAIRMARNAPPAVRQVLSPMVTALANYNKNAQQLIAMRLKTAYKVSSAPKILIPVSLSIAAGATATGMQVRNPYLGATGGSRGPYLYPWCITSFRTSNGESGALLPIRITQFLLGGHDYVAASLAGITYTITAAPAVQGWPAAAFAETKRGNWKTEIQPWNVVANHGGGTGFGSIMTETGFLQLGVFNGGSGTYVDTYSVYANATLCGSPFEDAQWTQVDSFRKAFAPLALQAPLAMKLAGDANTWLGSVLDRDDNRYAGNPAHMWVSRIDKVMQEINGFLENPPEGTAMGDTFFDASAMGFPLPEGAHYVDG